MDVIEELKSFWENSHKKNFKGGGGSVEELKFLCKLKKKKIWGGGGGGGGRVLGVRMGVNEELKCFCEN